MKLVNALNACNVIAPSKDIRFYLNGVAVHTCTETGKLAAFSATDGHSLVLVTVNKEISLYQCNATVLSKNDIKLINVKYPNLDINGLDGVTVEQLKNIMGECEKIDGRYPDIMRVIPKPDRKSEFENVGLNVEYLANIHKIHAQAQKGNKRKQFPVWVFNFGSSAMDSLKAAATIGDIDIVYVQMPARI